MKHFVMETAGQTGHGKTALIRTLTGEPCFGGHKAVVRMRFDETLLDIVDLPGNGEVERLLAGMADADMALLAISVDEGITQQTREHLRILSLYDISRCIIVLTKTDLVDEEQLTLFNEGVHGLCVAWGLPLCTPIVEVSACTGVGVEELIETIVAQCALMPVRRYDRPFYMHVENREGFRATGIVREGMVRPGEEIMLCPNGGIVCVRTVWDTQGDIVTQAHAGQRVMLELSASAENVYALSAILPGAAAGFMDVHILAVPEGSILEHGMRVKLYVGTAMTFCRVYLPRGGCMLPGESGYGQLVSETPISALSGERFAIRFISAEGLVGGGIILDAHAPERESGENWRASSARMSCYEYGGKDGRLHWEASAALCTEEMLRERFARWSDSEFRRTRDILLAKGLLVRAGELLLGAQLAGSLKGELIEHVTLCHALKPFEAGMPMEEARRICPGGLLELCLRDGTLKQNGNCVSLPLFDPQNTFILQKSRCKNSLGE